MESEAKFSELNNLLIALQLFSITLLQKKAVDEESKAFFHKVTDTVFDLQAVLENPTTDVVSHFHDDIRLILDENNKQASDFKLDDKLVSLLKEYTKTREHTKKNVNANLSPENEIKQRIKALEEGTIYLSPPQTIQTQQFDSKIEEILQTLNAKDKTYKQKNIYLKNTLVDLNSLVNEIKTNLLSPVTNVQSEELNSIQNQIQELGYAYTRKVQTEQDEEVALQNDIKKLKVSNDNKDKLLAAEKMNQLADKYFTEEDYDIVEKYSQDSIEFLSEMENSAGKNELESHAYETLAHTSMKLQHYDVAKINFQMAADLLQGNPAKAAHIQKLHQHKHIAEEKVVEQIIKGDKDINELERIKNILKTSGDVLLVAFTNKTINGLYQKLINPSIKPAIKVQLINKFTEDWQKYLTEKSTAATKPEWYTPEMIAMIDHRLLNTIRMIRETFSAQAAQHVSAEDMIGAKEKVLQEKEQAEREAAAARAKQEEYAKKRAIEEEGRRKARADEEEKLRIQASVAAKIRHEELQSLRNKINNLITTKTPENLQLAMDHLSLIKPEERANEDFNTLATTHVSLGLLAKEKNNINQAQQQLQEAIKHYDFLLNKKQFRDAKVAKEKIDTLTELGRLSYLENNYAQANVYFSEALKEISYFKAQLDLDANIKSQLKDSEKYNKAYSLLMNKLIGEEPVVEDTEQTDLIERLLHYKDLQKNVITEEKKLIDQIIKADPKLQSKLPRVQRLQEILTRIEHAPLKKNIILSAINTTESKDVKSPLDIQDKAILQTYHEAMVNLAFAETLKEVSGSLPSDMLSYAEKIELIRSQLRAGQEAIFAGLGLTLEQKIAYIEYESQLLRKETEGVKEQPTITRARVNLNSLVNKYRRELVNPTVAQGIVKRRRRWSMGNVVSRFRRRNKKTNAVIGSNTRTK